jgi:head-tail adaptor
VNLLSDKDLALMRATADGALPDTCVIQSQTFVSDSGGGGSVTWTAAGTVACRIAPVNTRGQAEGETGERLTANSDHVVTLPAQTSIGAESRIIVNGGTFNVELVRERSWPVTQRVEVAKQS